MDLHDLTRSLKTDNDSKIVLMVADGIGGLPIDKAGKTELETADTPNLDKLAAANVTGMAHPVLPFITPGSGPGHLGLFGYDPLKYVIGRGALEAAGIDFDLGPNDVAIRGNFCTVDDNGLITDRRAGRIATEQSGRLVEKLRAIKIEGVQVFVEPVREHRFVVVFRGAGLDDRVDDTDPQKTGVKVLDPVARDPGSKKTADIAREFARQAAAILKNDHPANMHTMRGFAKRPPLPSMEEVYGLKSAACAVYPMYRGLARLVGMDVLPQVANADEQVAMMKDKWSEFDFFFFHYKYTDSTGEDGNFDAKVEKTALFDHAVGKVMELKPDVLVVTGDHSTPSKMASHSFHPVPVLIASDSCRPDNVRKFGERDCACGGLGIFEAKYLIPIALAHAGRLNKYGA